MKLAHLVPMRNKALCVEKSLRCVLAQTHSPLEIILSDQGSTDGTLEIAQRVRNEYHGSNHVRILQCPHTEYKGRVGANVHLNWMIEQTDADVIVISSDDDLDDPQRCARMAEMFERYKPSYVGARMKVAKPDAMPHAETYMPDRHSRWINVAEGIQHGIISSMAASFRRDMYVRFGGLQGLESGDFIIPAMALFEHGVYYLDEPLYTYVEHASPDNCGIEGIMRYAKNAEEVMRIGEINEMHNCLNWVAVWKRWTQAGYMSRLSAEANQALLDKIMTRAESWCRAREQLTLNRIAPKNMEV